MISKKLWNTFSRATKTSVLKLIDKDASIPTTIARQLIEPYFHDFDYDDTGTTLKKLLENLYIQSDGSLKVTVSLTPTYEEVVRPVKVTKAAEKIAEIKEKAKSDYYLKENMLSILKSYKKNNTGRIRSEGHRNYCFEDISIYKNKVYIDIYWQGDSTDGNYSYPLSEILYGVSGNRGYMVINDEKGYIDRYGYKEDYHSPITIYKEDIYDYLRQVINEIVK